MLCALLMAKPAWTLSAGESAGKLLGRSAAHAAVALQNLALNDDNQIAIAKAKREAGI